MIACTGSLHEIRSLLFHLAQASSRSSILIWYSIEDKVQISDMPGATAAWTGGPFGAHDEGLP